MSAFSWRESTCGTKRPRTQGHWENQRRRDGGSDGFSLPNRFPKQMCRWMTPRFLDLATCREIKPLVGLKGETSKFCGFRTLKLRQGAGKRPPKGWAKLLTSTHAGSARAVPQSCRCPQAGPAQMFCASVKSESKYPVMVPSSRKKLHCAKSKGLGSNLHTIGGC